jgi:hypothetical protein
MSKSEHKACYGTMFPDTLHLEDDRRIAGKAFSFVLHRAGGTFRSGRSVAVDMEQWDDCVACPEFDHCHKVCLGKLALADAIGDK